MNLSGNVLVMAATGELGRKSCSEMGYYFPSLIMASILAISTKYCTNQRDAYAYQAWCTFCVGD